MYDFSYADILFDHERSQDKENALAYDLTSMAGDCADLDALVNDLFDTADLAHLITARSAKTRRSAETRIKTALRSLLWHLHQAMHIDADCYVRLSLRTCFYVKSSARNPHGITRVLRDIVHHLTQTGWIECYKGFLDRRSGVGKMTRVRACSRLTLRLKAIPDDLSERGVENSTAQGVNKSTVGDVENLTATNVKNLTAQSVENSTVTFRRAGDATKTALQMCAIDSDIIAAEALLNDYNAVIAHADITLGDHRRNFLRLSDGQTVNLNRTSLTAIYHVEDDGRITYGRMHGGFWQNIPKALRQHLRINGCATVEYDYSAQALNIVAALEGLRIDGDGYDIDLGLSGISAAFERKFVKTFIVVMLNARDTNSAFRAIRQAFRTDMAARGVSGFLHNETLQRCADMIFETHSFLRAYCCSGKGKDIFAHDAALARDILRCALADQIIVLPIHDGFITTTTDADRLHAIMQDCWATRFGTTIQITRENHQNTYKYK